MRGLLSDRTLGRCGDQAKLHQLLPSSAVLVSPPPFSSSSSFNQSSRSLMLPSLWAGCQTVSIDVSAAVITKSIHRCLGCTGVSLGRRVLRSTPLRHVRLFLQSERENNL